MDGKDLLRVQANLKAVQLDDKDLLSVEEPEFKRGDVPLEVDKGSALIDHDSYRVGVKLGK